MDYLINILKKLLSLFQRKEYLDINEIHGGLLGIGEQDTDYIFGSTINLIKEVNKRGIINRQVYYEYNQGLQYETRNWCTIYSAITEVSWLMDYKYSLKEILAIGRKMVVNNDLDPDQGAYLHKAIDYVRKDWNERFPNKQIESYRIAYDDEEFRDFMIHGNVRLTQLGYRTSSELFNEIQSKGYANEKNYPRGGGHAVSQWGLNTINNYKGKVLANGKKYRNRFSFTYIDELIDNGIIYNTGYMFLRKLPI